jgi:hypothetical protein
VYFDFLRYWAACIIFNAFKDIALIQCSSLLTAPQQNKLQTLWPESVSELYQPSESHLSAMLVPSFADSAAWSARRITYGRNLGFLDRSRYFFFQAATQLY